MKRLLTIAASIILYIQIVSVAWALQMERPSLYPASIGGKIIGNKNTNGEASVGLGVALNYYAAPPNGYEADFIEMNVSMTANSRMGIQYVSQTFDEVPDWMKEDWPDSNKLLELSNCGDDWGTWVDLPQPFRFKFYGAKYKHVDAENVHSKIWVCTNGFLSFDLSNSNSSSPCGIPTCFDPNAIIAPLWTDLIIDDQSKIIFMWSLSWPGSHEYFVVIWKNAKHKYSGQRLTFAVALEGYPGDQEEQPQLDGGPIYMAYQSVSSIGSCYFTYGIEDHEGGKGTGKREYGTALGSLNGKHKVFTQNSNNQFIRRLTLEFEDQNYQNAEYYFFNKETFIRGHNCRTKTYPPPQQDSTLMFLKSIGSTYTLLGGAAGYLLVISTFQYTAPVSVVLVTYSWIETLARYQYDNIEQLDLKDDGTTPPGGELQRAYIKVPTSSDIVEDASLSVVFHWVLKSSYTDSRHNLTIIATNTYCETNQIEKNVTTLTNIKINPENDNNSFDTAQLVSVGTYGLDPMLWLGGNDHQDFYKKYLQAGYYISLSMTPPPGQNFDLYLYNPNRVVKASSVKDDDSTESIFYQADSEGYWFIEVRWSGGQGFYTITIDATSGGGGEGCPTLFVWNGNSYVDYGVINIHNPTGEDVIREVPIQAEDVGISGYKAKFRLREGWEGLNFSESVIDQVRLYAVDNYGNRYPCPLINAIHSSLGNVLLQLLLSDDYRVQTLLLETIDLTFIMPYQNIQNYTFTIEGCNQNKQ